MLRPNYRGSIGYGNAFYRDMVGGYFTQHAPRRAGRRGRADQAGHRRPGSAGGDGMERRGAHRQQADHVHRPVQGRRRRAPAPRTGCRCFAQTDLRGQSHAVVRRHAVAEERADRAVLGSVAAQGRREREDADAVFRRRERHSRVPLAAGDRDVSGAQGERRADQAVCRAAREASTCGWTCGIRSSRPTPSWTGSSDTSIAAAPYAVARSRVRAERGKFRRARTSRPMSQIFHRSTNTIARVSIFGAVFFVAGLLGLFDADQSLAVGDRGARRARAADPVQPRAPRRRQRHRLPLLPHVGRGVVVRRAFRRPRPA